MEIDTKTLKKLTDERCKSDFERFKLAMAEPITQGRFFVWLHKKFGFETQNFTSKEKSMFESGWIAGFSSGIEYLKSKGAVLK